MVAQSLLGTPLRVKFYESEDSEWRPLKVRAVYTLNEVQQQQHLLPAHQFLFRTFTCAARKRERKYEKKDERLSAFIQSAGGHSNIKRDV